MFGRSSHFGEFGHMANALMEFLLCTVISIQNLVQNVELGIKKSQAVLHDNRKGCLAGGQDDILGR